MRGARGGGVEAEGSRPKKGRHAHNRGGLRAATQNRIACEGGRSACLLVARARTESSRFLPNWRRRRSKDVFPATRFTYQQRSHQQEPGDVLFSSGDAREGGEQITVLG